MWALTFCTAEYKRFFVQSLTLSSHMMSFHEKKEGNLVSEPFHNYHKHGEPYPVGVKSFRLPLFTIFFLGLLLLLLPLILTHFFFFKYSSG